MSSAGLRLGFAGSPQAACVALEALLQAKKHRIDLVLAQPDRPRGRGRELGSVPIKALAEAHGLPLYQPENTAALERIEALGKLDLLIVVAYGQRLSAACLAMPRLGCINLHFSLLPRWRGAAPVQHAILQGDRETGVSIFRLNEGIDTGPVLRQAGASIAPGEDAASLLARLSRVGAECLLDTIDDLAAGRTRQHTQDRTLVTYAPRIKRADAYMDWHQPATGLERQVRAYNPTPGAHTTLGGIEIRVWEAQAMPPGNASSPPGTPAAAGPEGVDVIAGESTILRLRRVQPAGGKTMCATAFARGRRQFKHLWN